MPGFVFRYQLGGTNPKQSDGLAVPQLVKQSAGSSVYYIRGSGRGFQSGLMGNGLEGGIFDLRADHAALQAGGKAPVRKERVNCKSKASADALLFLSANTENLVCCTFRTAAIFKAF